jgi:SAM-dependent methyltransferase
MGHSIAAFDSIALQYDALWSHSAVGIAQREAVWRYLDPLFKPGDDVLDVGCGTGVDALHLQSAGVSVYAIDASAKMVEIARRRGVDAHHCAIEGFGTSEKKFDGVISNFGALNLLASLEGVERTLADIVRSGGVVAICLLGRFCLWETLYQFLRADPSKALRRLRGKAEASLGSTVYYPSVERVAGIFRKHFRLRRWVGIGLTVPPSFVKMFTPWEVERLSAFDRHLAHRRILRACADHRLLLFERI